MSVIVDQTPVTAQRIRRTRVVHIVFDSLGNLVQVVADRVTAVQVSGNDIVPVVAASSVVILAGSIPAGIVAQLQALYTKVDSLDPGS